MTPYRCIIVEDEPLAAEILAEYIGETTFLSLTHVCNDAIEALEVVRNFPVDVIFLDINLPKLNGIDFIKTLRKQPKIIITSAHHEYAVAGFDLQVTDYLLKPIEFSRFTKAVQKLITPFGTSDSVAIKSASKEVPHRPFYFFQVNKRAVKIFLDEILYLESVKDAVMIHTKSKSYLTHYFLGELEELINSENLLRVHRSFVVAIDKIDAFTAVEVRVGERVMPIGRSYKTFAMSRLIENK
jgi:DNA-binding LytR/AlgR family response regulator